MEALRGGWIKGGAEKIVQGGKMDRVHESCDEGTSQTWIQRGWLQKNSARMRPIQWVR